MSSVPNPPPAESGSEEDKDKEEEEPIVEIDNKIAPDKEELNNF